MAWTIVRVVAVAGTCVVAARAQQPAPNELPASRVTITGCVERADQLTGAGAGSQALDTDSLSFVLMRSSREAPPMPPASSAASSANSSPVGTSGVTPELGDVFWLDAPADKLTAQVGHEVKVSGTVSLRLPRSGDTAASSLATAPRMKVDDITTTAETCPRQQR